MWLLVYANPLEETSDANFNCQTHNGKTYTRTRASIPLGRLHRCHSLDRERSRVTKSIFRLVRQADRSTDAFQNGHLVRSRQ